MGQQQSIPGPRGPVGPKGEMGSSLKELMVRDGRIKATFSDGTEKDLGNAGGPEGPKGRGIQSIAIDKGVMELIYTDNTKEKVEVKELSEGSLKQKTMWCVDGDVCTIPEGATGIDLIQRNLLNVNEIHGKHDNDWFRIKPNTKNGTAFHNNISIKEGGGLSVGEWKKVPEGSIEATGYIKVVGGDPWNEDDGVIAAGNKFSGGDALHIVGHGKKGRKTVIYGDVVIKGKLHVEKDLRPAGNVDVGGTLQAHSLTARQRDKGNVVRYDDHLAIQHYGGRGALQAGSAWNATTSSNANGDWEKWKLTRR